MNCVFNPPYAVWFFRIAENQPERLIITPVFILIERVVTVCLATEFTNLYRDLYVLRKPSLKTAPFLHLCLVSIQVYWIPFSAKQ